MESGSGELQQLPRKAKQNPSSSIKPFAELRNIWIWTRLHSRGKILVDFCLGWALLSVSSLQCSVACTPEVQHLGRGFHRWRLELKPWPRSKGKHDSGGLDSIPRGASSTSSAHAQGGTHSPNTPRCLRIWRSGLGRVSNCSPRRWSNRSGWSNISRAVWEAGIVPDDTLPGSRQACKPLLFTSITRMGRISP